MVSCRRPLVAPKYDTATRQAARNAAATHRGVAVSLPFRDHSVPQSMAPLMTPSATTPSTPATARRNADASMSSPTTSRLSVIFSLGNLPANCSSTAVDVSMTPAEQMHCSSLICERMVSTRESCTEAVAWSGASTPPTRLPSEMFTAVCARTSAVFLAFCASLNACVGRRQAWEAHEPLRTRGNRRHTPSPSR